MALIDNSRLQNLGIVPELWSTTAVKVEEASCGTPDPDSDHGLQLERDPWPQPEMDHDLRPEMDHDLKPEIDPWPQPEMDHDLKPAIDPWSQPVTISASQPEIDHEMELNQRKRPVKQRKPKKKKKLCHEHMIKLTELVTFERPILNNYQEEILKGTDEFAKGVVDICMHSKPNLLTINDAGRYLIFTSWISIARVFESSHNKYTEKKRIPQNKIDIVPNVVTSLHIADQKLHLAYCWGHHSHPEKSYIEIRDLITDENNLKKRVFYDQMIENIYSDNLYLYVMLSDGLVHIHRRELYDCNYQVDYSLFGSHVGRNIVAVMVLNDLCYFSHISRLILIAATNKEILISRKYMDNHELVSCNMFEKSELNIISMEAIDNLIIITRRCGSQIKEETSEINLGYIRTDTTSIEFVLEYTLGLKCSIVKTLVTKSGHIIIFTRKKTLYEVASLWLPKLQLTWVTILQGVNLDSDISAFDENHLVIAKTCQDFITIKVDISKRYRCPSCELFFPDDKILDLHTNDMKHVSAFKNIKCEQDKVINDNHSSALKRLKKR